MEYSGSYPRIRSTLYGVSFFSASCLLLYTQWKVQSKITHTQTHLLLLSFPLWALSQAALHFTDALSPKKTPNPKKTDEECPEKTDTIPRRTPSSRHHSQATQKQNPLYPGAPHNVNSR